MNSDLHERARAIAQALRPISLDRRIALAEEALDGRIVFTTSFGLEDQAITHALRSTARAVDIVTLDTGRLFPETYELWAETERLYGRRIAGFMPDGSAAEQLVAADGIDGFRRSVAARRACCDVRKVAPLGKALAGAQGWLTGLRAEQSPDRAGTLLAAYDVERGLIKINPLADWSRERLLDYVAAHDIPTSPLHRRGFASIGCAPCTRALRPGEPERSGRWWWEEDAKKECGLHLKTPSPPLSSALEQALA